MSIFDLVTIDKDPTLLREIIRSKKYELMNEMDTNSNNTFILLSKVIFDAADSKNITLADTLAEYFSMIPSVNTPSKASWINSIIRNRHNVTINSLISSVYLGIIFDESMMRDLVFYSKDTINDEDIYINAYEYCLDLSFLSVDDLLVIASEYDRELLFKKTLLHHQREISDFNRLFSSIIKSNLNASILIEIDKLSKKSIDYIQQFSYAVYQNKTDKVKIIYKMGIESGDKRFKLVATSLYNEFEVLQQNMEMINTLKSLLM